MSGDVRSGRTIFDRVGGHQFDRRKMIRTGLQAGAALNLELIRGTLTAYKAGAPRSPFKDRQEAFEATLGKSGVKTPKPPKMDPCSQA